jgi:hypothetical protein
MSTLTISNLSDGTKTIATTNVTNGSAKSWSNFFQTDTQSFRDSLNCSSLTDNGTGASTLTYTSAFANANYCTTYGVRDGGGENDDRMLIGSDTDGYYTATNQRLYCSAGSGTLNDAGYGFTSSFGDLA